MPQLWKSLKSIISNTGYQGDLFLSLIDKEGNILYANATMQRTLHLDDPRTKKANFFNLIPPEHIPSFKDAIDCARAEKTPCSTEIFLKNGFYHPMKWQVNHLDQTEDSKDNYFCVGYKLVDEERTQQFNALGEHNYKLIVEGLNAGVLFQDTRGELIAANKKAADIFNSTLERLYQLKDVRSMWDGAWSITSEEGKTVLFDETPFMRALVTGKVQSQTVQIKLLTGEDKWVLFNSQPLFHEKSAIPFSVVTNIVDVTLERKLTGEVQDTDMLFRSFLSKTPNLAWVLDEDAMLLFASDSFYCYFNIDEKTAVNKSIFDLIPGSVAEALYAKHMQVLENEAPVETVEKVKWADGTQFVFHVNLFPIWSMSGKRLVGGQAVNLADKYAAEKQLNEANERLLLLSRATTDAIWEWDMQTGQIFRNEALMEMIGYHLEDAKGLSWWLRRIHPEDRNRVTDKIKDATDLGQQSWRDEYRFRCSDGTYKNIQDKGFVVYENGLPVKMIGSLQDITMLKNLEDQLTQEKMQKQKEISETAIRVQEKERTRIGHELHDNVNQILSTTKMFIEMLHPECEDEKQIKGKCIEYILTSIEEIRKLSKELVVPQLKEAGLVDSIYSLVEDIQMTCDFRVRFVHDLDAERLSPGKKVTIFRIIQEQLKNIIKYSKAKQVDIYLQCKKEMAQLILKDDGVGFDTRQIHQGIGLSNIHDRAKFYNGTVDIQSSPGKGCELTVAIPLPG